MERKKIESLKENIGQNKTNNKQENTTVKKDSIDYLQQPLNVLK